MYELCRGSLQYGYVLQLKVSFRMGLFSDTKHTHPGIFILESPPPPPGGGPGEGLDEENVWASPVRGPGGEGGVPVDASRFKRNNHPSLYHIMYQHPFSDTGTPLSYTLGH